MCTNVKKMCCSKKYYKEIIMENYKEIYFILFNAITEATKIKKGGF